MFCLSLLALPQRVDECSVHPLLQAAVGAVRAQRNLKLHHHAEFLDVVLCEHCRWQDRLYSSSCLAHKPVDTLMLDTTYASPKHTFPPQEEAVSMMVQVRRTAQHLACWRAVKGGVDATLCTAVFLLLLQQSVYLCSGIDSSPTTSFTNRVPSHQQLRVPTQDMCPDQCFACDQCLAAVVVLCHALPPNVLWLAHS
jgi:hypothetical protein